MDESKIFINNNNTTNDNSIQNNSIQRKLDVKQQIANKKRLNLVERKIETLTADCKNIECKLEKISPDNLDNLISLGEELKLTKEELDKYENEWLDLTND